MPLPLPLPIRFIKYLIAKWRFPIIGIGSAVLFPLLLVFYYAGVLSPNQASLSWANPLQLIGLFLVFALLPAYMLMCLTGWIRSSESLYQEILPLLESDTSGNSERYRKAHFWPLGIFFGVLYAATVNIGWESLSFNPRDPIFATSVLMVLGQFFMWSTIGVVLFLLIHDDLTLNQHGKLVRINLYDLDSLNGFGSAASSGLLMVFGALAISVLQSLDREFRLDSYINGFYVAVPAAAVLMLLPIWSVHRRIVAAKASELTQINQQIRQASSGLQAEALLHLNGLLQRRALIQSLRTWPMDLSLFSRIVLYVFIPPLAWAGAALTELVVDSFIVG